MNPGSVHIIIPSYNEASILPETIQPLTNAGYKVIVVDDASSDNTRQILREHPIHYLRHRINLGQGAAIQTGIEYARRNGAIYFVTFDADGQHDSNDIAAMTGKLEKEGIDIIFGSRFLPGAKTNITGIRRFTLQCARWMNYMFTGILLSDAHNGLRVFNQKAAGLIKLKENRMAHATEFMLQVKKHDLKYAEYPAHIRYTDYSKKKGQSLLNSVRIFFELILNKIFD